MDCSAKKRVMRVDDHALDRDGLRILVEREAGMDAVGYHSPALHDSAVAAGACRFLAKGAEFPELADAIRTAQAEAPPERRTE